MKESWTVVALSRVISDNTWLVYYMEGTVLETAQFDAEHSTVYIIHGEVSRYIANNKTDRGFVGDIYIPDYSYIR
jgi:hypothetical protein